MAKKNVITIFWKSHDISITIYRQTIFSGLFTTYQIPLANVKLDVQPGDLNGSRIDAEIDFFAFREKDRAALNWHIISLRLHSIQKTDRKHTAKQPEKSWNSKFNFRQDPLSLQSLPPEIPLLGFTDTFSCCSFSICPFSFVQCHLSFVLRHLSFVICPLSFVQHNSSFPCCSVSFCPEARPLVVVSFLCCWSGRPEKPICIFVCFCKWPLAFKADTGGGKLIYIQSVRLR